MSTFVPFTDTCPRGVIEDTSNSTTPHDRLFKQLLATFIYEFIELFLPDLAKLVEPDSLVPLDKELFATTGTGTRREADLVYKARLRAQNDEQAQEKSREVFFLIHLEHEAQDRGGFPRRMFRYFSLLHELYDLPIYPVALFSYQTSRKKAASSYRIAFPKFEPLRFRYQTIQLNRLSWRKFLRKLNPVAAALMSRMNIRAKDRPKVKAASLRQLANLNLEKTNAILISSFVETYLRLDSQEEERFTAEIRDMAPVEQEAILELTNSWIEKGIKQGIEQGIKQERERTAEAERQRDLLAARLRELGVDPDELT